MTKEIRLSRDTSRSLPRDIASSPPRATQVAGGEVAARHVVEDCWCVSLHCAPLWHAAATPQVSTHGYYAPTRAAVAARAPPGGALPQPALLTLTAHGRPVSHLQRRDALLDPLHGLVLAAVASREPRAGHYHGRGVGQDSWRCAWGEHIGPRSSILVGCRWIGRRRWRIPAPRLPQVRLFASLAVWGCRAFPRLVLPELSFSGE